MTTNFFPPPSTLAAIHMTPEQYEKEPRRASILAGRHLRNLGYDRKYNHAAWDRGMRWFTPQGIALREMSNTDALTYALTK